MTDKPGNTPSPNTMDTLAGPSDFPTTRWTVLVAAADPHRKDAGSTLVSLCEGYCYPLFVKVCRGGDPPDRAQDLTQGVFHPGAGRPVSRSRRPGKGVFGRFFSLQ